MEHIGSGSQNGNQWSFDMSFAQKSIKNALIFKNLVSMVRAQSGELGIIYFCRRWIYISHFFSTLMIKKMAKIANFAMSTCMLQLNFELYQIH